MADQYRKPYLDSSIFIAWVKGEVIGTVDRGKVAQHILSSAENGKFSIYTSTLTLAEVHKLRIGPVLPIGDSDKILEYLERKHVKVIDVDRRIGEHANRLCREYGIYPNDAIHMASALRAGCDVLYAWDNRFTKVTGDLIIVKEPAILEPTLFEERVQP